MCRAREGQDIPAIQQSGARKIVGVSLNRATGELMFTIYRRAENDELTEVATAEDRVQADKLMERLKKLWSADYEVREENSSEARSKLA